MDDLQRYQYRPILENDGIRLLELEPDPELNARIKCSLIHTTLHEYDHDLINHYTALSYVWGGSTILKSILVEGHEFRITPNLDSALRYMRDPTRRCLIWADAICINQSDDEEKNGQVRQMGDVYRHATHTIIFLGEPTQNTDAVLNAVRSNATLTVDREALEALPWQEILARPWFQRVWVYQELLFSVDPWVQCGRGRVRWELLHNTVKSLTQANRYVHPWKDILIMQEGKKSFFDQSDQSDQSDDCALAFVFRLLAVLDNRRGFGVLDPRDVLFAHSRILGPSPRDDKQNKLIDIDYTKDFIDVYRDIVRYTLPILKNYRIISYAECNPQLDGRGVSQASQFPTWVPDWTQKKPLYPRPLLRDVATLEKIYADPNDYQIKPCFLHSDRLLLCVTGERVGKLCMVTDLITKQELSLQLRPGCMKEGQYTRGTRKAIESVIFHHWETLLDFLMSAPPSEPSSLGGGRQPKPKEEISSCILRTDVDWIKGDLTDPMLAEKRERLIRHLVLHSIYEDSDEYRHFLYGRRFGKLQNGRLVLVPGGARVGDKMCFFWGDFMVPFLLREYDPLNGASDVEAELRNDHGVKVSTKITHFEVVGECLIDELIARPAHMVESVLKLKSQPESFVLH
ncbi:hypothetical protein ONS95_004145 [Cadophora gregata]|uniref:uncharacterized protein n=1 Tax=Cadophora gregata TaxID=51156 RepID=UPI0026DDC01B|nr:uncharacterized protein ONS95_004145 [Cadophora gregata]KAK0105493.1 hypothetical protein ONS96_004878 [Cadophora gregata f. sp. sojae]KAK0105615.1 hypothetical protein ONS95_004145 [Cadophora gregata]